jgi:integrase
MTTRHRLDCLRGALSRAVRWELIDTNPAKEIDLPAVPRRTVRAMSPDDARALLAAVEGTWFAPLVTVALYTGLRQGELLGLRWEDVSLDGPTLTVHHSLARLPGRHGIRYVLDAPKSAKSRRTIPLAAPAAEALRTARKADMDDDRPNPLHLVFCRWSATAGRMIPLDGTALTHAFQEALEATDKAHKDERDYHPIGHVRWHDLRHGTASILLANGVPMQHVSAILGHSSIGVTVDVYGHLTEETKSEAMEKLSAALA